MYICMYVCINEGRPGEPLKSGEQRPSYRRIEGPAHQRRQCHLIFIQPVEWPWRPCGRANQSLQRGGFNSSKSQSRLHMWGGKDHRSGSLVCPSLFRKRKKIIFVSCPGHEMKNSNAVSILLQRQSQPNSDGLINYIHIRKGRSNLHGSF